MFQWRDIYGTFRRNGPCNKKYEQEKVDRIIFRVPKGMKGQMQLYAEQKGASLAAFLNRAVKETIERDNKD